MKRILPLAIAGTLLASTGWAATPAPASTAPAQQATATAATPAKERPRAARWVKDAQKQLKAAGFDPGRIDGVIGKKTRAAVKAFQTAKNLPAHGRLDSATRKALKG